ncbi:MAG: transporter [Bacteroidaceae bacterium]|nr:transporter [Bacteroidaceae bacterium]
MKSIIRFLKDWTLPVAITVGVSLYFVFTRVDALHAASDILAPCIDVLFPMNIFLILWATFCKVNFMDLRLAHWSGGITAVQLVGGALALSVAVLTTGNVRLIAMGTMACFLAPCATASPVVTGKLGGNITRMTAYVLLSSLLATLTIPVCAAFLKNQGTVSIATLLRTASAVFARVATVLTLPLLLGWMVRHYVPSVHRWVMNHSDLPFYLWSLALAVTSGVTVRGIDQSGLPLSTLLALAACALVVCLLQFGIGRRIGSRHESRVEGGQALGQKNTALIIWATAAFLSPAAALAPGCYVLWQNMVNSWQLYRAKK